MNAWLRQIASRLNASYWFLPALLTLGAIVLSFVTYLIDVRVGSDWLRDIGWLHQSKPDGARALLSTIAGSMISVAGTVFAITIAAVVYASGNYGPRLLSNFMTDRGNQLSLGVFIATFVYCLLVLRTIRQPDEAGGLLAPASEGFVPEFSLIVAFLLSLLSVGVLVFFLHHVPDSIRIHRVVATIGRRAIRDIEDRFPDDYHGPTIAPPALVGGVRVRARRTGYVEIIDFSTFADICSDKKVRVQLLVRTGDFVHPDMALLEHEGAIDEDTAESLRKAFAIGASRTATQDIEFSIDELVEIALRALSPGINDAFTAITCLHWISAATAALAMRDLRRDVEGNRYGAGGVLAIADDFDHFVKRGFGAVRTSAAANRLAALNFVEALENAGAGKPPPERTALLQAEATALLQQARHVLAGPALEEVTARIGAFRT